MSILHNLNCGIGCLVDHGYEQRHESCRAALAASEARIKTLEQTVDILRKIHEDPPPDIQELVIKKLNLVSADVQAKLEASEKENERLRKLLHTWLHNFIVAMMPHNYEHMRANYLILAQIDLKAIVPDSAEGKS